MKKAQGQCWEVEAKPSALGIKINFYHRGWINLSDYFEQPGRDSNGKENEIS